MMRDLFGGTERPPKAKKKAKPSAGLAQKAFYQRHRQAMLERAKKQREAQKEAVRGNPEKASQIRETRRAYKAKVRARNLLKGLTSNGTTPKILSTSDDRFLRAQDLLAERNARQAWQWWLKSGSSESWREAYANSKKEAESEKVRSRHRQQYATDRRYAIYHRVKRWMHKHLTMDNKVSFVWSKLLGYGPTELMAHLESQFKPGMGWENRHLWDIDHIKPVALFEFTSPQEEAFRQCFALSNLQPLWREEHRLKSNEDRKLIRAARAGQAASSKQDMVGGYESY